MYPIYLTFALATFLVVLFRSFLFFYKNDRKKKVSLFRQLSHEGTANNLTFCSQEILQNKVIGIDGIHRKIMVLEKINRAYNCSIISLDDVQHCELVKNCGSLNSNNLKKLERERNLHAIELQFEFKNQVQPASIIFYDSLINSKRELVLLKAKAEYWSQMLSKLLVRQVTVRA
jgi:hypothetical protein